MKQYLLPLSLAFAITFSGGSLAAVTDDTAASAKPDVLVSYQILDGDKVITASTLLSKNEESTHMFAGTERSYRDGVYRENGVPVYNFSPLKDGADVWVSPFVKDNDEITTYVNVKISQLVSMGTMEFDGLTIDAPTVFTSELGHKLHLTNGKEASVPFGPVFKGKSRFTLKISAKKVD